MPTPRKKSGKSLSSDGFLSAEAYQGLTSEQDFQDQVVERATMLGWRVFYVPQWIWKLVFAHWKRVGPRAGKKWAKGGFPDLVMTRRGRLIFAELKVGYNKTQENQDEWIADLALIPCIEVFVWRPSDQGDIERVLA